MANRRRNGISRPSAGNAGSIGLHRALGFETAGLLAVGWKFERWLDVVLMQRRLGAGAESASRKIV